MNEKSLVLLTGYLDKIAEKIGVGTSVIWPWFIRQEYVEFFVLMVCLVISSICFGFYIKYALKHWNYENKEGYTIEGSDLEGFWQAGFVFGGALLVGLFAVALDNFIDILNPQYAALTSLISKIKN